MGTKTLLICRFIAIAMLLSIGIGCASEEPRWAVWVGGKAGYVDTSGAMVIQPQFDSASDFVD